MSMCLQVASMSTQGHIGSFFKFDSRRPLPSLPSSFLFLLCFLLFSLLSSLPLLVLSSIRSFLLPFSFYLLRCPSFFCFSFSFFFTPFFRFPIDHPFAIHHHPCFSLFSPSYPLLTLSIHLFTLSPFTLPFFSYFLAFIYLTTSSFPSLSLPKPYPK